MILENLTYQSWSVIIFCYNEQGSIELVTENAVNILKRISPNKCEVIIVDDGSTDGSTGKIKNLEKKYENVRAVYHATNLGIGRALLSGYAEAKMENVTAIPGDNQFDLNELIRHVALEDNTFVMFFRKANTSYTLYRNVLSYFNKKFNMIFLGYFFRDVNWVKIYKNKDLKSLNLELKSSLVESEICSKLMLVKGIKLIEAESYYNKRTTDKDKGASFKVVMQAVSEMIKLIFAVRRFSKKLRQEEERS